MSSLPAAVAERLGKLIPRLASDHDGKIAATGRAISRTLAGAGLDLHDLAARAVAEPQVRAVVVREPAPRRPPKSSRSGWRASPRSTADPDALKVWRNLVSRCEHLGRGRMSAWESTFVASMGAWVDRGALLTARQAERLRELAKKLGA